MRRRLYIPEAVQSAIKAHVQERVAEVEERFLSAAEDEDTFTGQLGGLLGAGERKVEVDGPAWYWKIEYTKFRGRGKDVTEAKVGADGIFEIRVRGVEGGGQKSLLFQSKMGTPRGAEPKRQALKMSNWREAAVFLSYAPEGIRVSTFDQVMGDEGGKGKPFSDYFVDEYLTCHVGILISTTMRKQEPFNGVTSRAKGVSAILNSAPSPRRHYQPLPTPRRAAIDRRR